MKKALTRTALVLFAMSSWQAQAGVVHLVWDAHDKFQHEAEVKAGAILELCGKLPAKMVIAWSFKSSLAMASNIHFHQGKKVVYPAKHEAKEDLSDRLSTEVAQDYCWMWSNHHDKPAHLFVSLQQVK